MEGTRLQLVSSSGKSSTTIVSTMQELWQLLPLFEEGIATDVSSLFVPSLKMKRRLDREGVGADTDTLPSSLSRSSTLSLFPSLFSPTSPPSKIVSRPLEVSS